MSTITKQWLQQKIAEMEAARDDISFGLGEDGTNTLAALRIALASLEAEAVCVIDQSILIISNLAPMPTYGQHPEQKWVMCFCTAPPRQRRYLCRMI
ncbi:hypothetical protein [Escherichia coli]|uniref:hypothetical protein n=1 Tax=Escherichia coli TaxID=562 RepID=UPI003075D816